MSITPLPVRRASAEACVEVRIRTEHAISADAVYLCDYPVDELERLIQLIPRWGVIEVGDGETYGNPGGGAAGQFVLSDAEAFFEVILSKDEHQS